jgi:hypothetical protein
MLECTNIEHLHISPSFIEHHCSEINGGILQNKKKDRKLIRKVGRGYNKGKPK